MKRTNYLLLFALFLLLLSLGVTSAFAQITPSQDSYINTTSAATNFGSAATLGVVSSSSSIQTTYIQFDLSPIPSSYKSANVAKATLKLFVNSVTTGGSFNVDLVDGSWSEKTITADLLPALGTTIKGSIPLTTANVNNYIDIDLTTVVGEWLNGTQANDGIALVPNSGLSATFQSKENTNQSHPAELVIVFTNGATLTGITTASGSGLSGGSTSGSPSLSLLKTCSTNQVLQWNGSAWACASAGTGTVTSVTTASGSGLTGGGASGSLSIGLQKTCSTSQVLQWNGTAWVCASVGTGTVSGVKAGTDLTGGGTSGAVTLNLDTTKVPQLGTANTFTGNQSITGNLGVSGTVTGTFSGDGTGITNVNAAQLGGISAPFYPTLNQFNTFRTTQAFSGNGLVMYTGDPGCGAGFAGVGFGQLSNCNNYALAGSFTDTFLNRPLNGTLHLAENGVDEMTIYPGGWVGIATPEGPGAQLTVYQQTCCDSPGIFGGGYSAPGGSNSNGTTGLYGVGGDSDPVAIKAIGGDGVDALGGNGASTDGVGGSFFGGDTGGSTTGGDAVDASAGSGFAGNFTGDLNVTGAIMAGTKDFKIDHPLDPANKYLVHASVESSEMMNIYTGNVVTDAQGQATVNLPDWFEALNTDFRYQLTVVGQFAQAIVGQEIENHQFQIKTNAPNVKVSWQVTGVRHDAFAKAHPLVVEQEKEAALKGFYIHPELYGAPAEKQIEWARHPATMKRMKEHRAKAAQQLKKAAPQLKAIATKKP